MIIIIDACTLKILDWYTYLSNRILGNQSNSDRKKYIMEHKMWSMIRNHVHLFYLYPELVVPRNGFNV